MELSYVVGGRAMKNTDQAERKRRIAKALQLARRSKQLTQAQMALKIGKSSSAVAAYEQGVNSVPSDVLLAYCEVCSVDPNYVLGITNEGDKEDAELQLLLKKMTSSQKKSLLTFLKHFI